MPTWNEILTEITNTAKDNGKYNFDLIINKYINELSKYRNRNVIVYYSDFMNMYKGPNLGINDNDLDAFMNAVKGLDKTKGLDLIINTPGGDALATEGIVKYLHSIFNNNIEVFVPRMAMSAGTMLSCSSNMVWMGKHSFLGPIDPQLNGIPAYNIKKEFEDAKSELIKNPNTFRYYQITLSKYPHAFYYLVNDQIKLASKLVKKWLKEYMFNSDAKAVDKSRKIASKLNANAGSHSKHYDYIECKKIGLKVKDLESDNQLQDLVLSVYHSLQICGSRTDVCKYIVNQNGKAYISHAIINRQR